MAESRIPEGIARLSPEMIRSSAAPGIALLLLVLVVVSGAHVLSALRVYGAGEVAFARNHREAVVALFRLRDSHDSRDLEAFRSSLAAPLADSRARRLLASPRPDRAAAKAAFLEAGIPPEDVGAVVTLLPYLARFDGVARALAQRAAGDADVARLETLGSELAGVLATPAPDAARVGALFSEIEGIDHRLVATEEAFDRAIGRAIRNVRRIVVVTSVGLGASVFAVGLLSVGQLLRRLRRSESRFRAMIEYSQDMIVLLEVEGKVLYASPASERVLGWRPDELVGHSALKFCHPDDRAIVAAAQMRALTDPAATEEVEIRIQRKDRSWRIGAILGGAWPKEAGGPGTVATIRDVTEPRALANELSRARRLESIGRLAGGIAHDFNNLLTAILGSAAAAKQHLPTGSPLIEEIDEIVQAADRAALLTHQLLAFARRQVVEPRVFDVHDVIGAMGALLRRLLGAQIELTIDLAPMAAPVRADPGQIEQVLVNLATNARDAMPEGGRLSIATRVSKDRVRIEVTDTGGAMSDEVREHAFEPFFTTKGDGQGTGLGLAICYGIVTQNGGTIGIESAAGVGTTFGIELPRAEAPPVELRRDEAVGAEPRHDLLMVVEDEASVRRIAVRALRDRGYRVLEAPDSQVALRLATESPEPIALLVTDVVMPGLGGRQLAERLRATWPEMRVLYTSGFSEDPLVLYAVEHETAAFLQKPFTPSTLARKVRDVLDAAKPVSGG